MAFFCTRGLAVSVELCEKVSFGVQCDDRHHGGSQWALPRGTTKQNNLCRNGIQPSTKVGAIQDNQKFVPPYDVIGKIGPMTRSRTQF